MNVGSVESSKLVMGIEPKTTSSAITCDYVSVKNAASVRITVNLTQAAGHATAITPKRATAVDGTGVTTFSRSMRIWANEDTAATDTLVAQTAATSYTVAADVKNKMVVFEIDVRDFGEAYDVLGCAIAASSEATNFASVTYELMGLRYNRSTPPAAITN